MLLIGLKAPTSDGRSDRGPTFLLAGKKLPETDTTLVVEILGRSESEGSCALGPVGVKVLAAGLGLNSIALALNLVARELGLASPESAAGPVGGVLIV